jgi:hypothetical protein
MMGGCTAMRRSGDVCEGCGACAWACNGRDGGGRGTRGDRGLALALALYESDDMAGASSLWAFGRKPRRLQHVVEAGHESNGGTRH